MPGIGRRRIGSGVRRGGRRAWARGSVRGGLQCAIERAVMVAAEYFTVNGELTQGSARRRPSQKRNPKNRREPPRLASVKAGAGGKR